MKSGRDEAARGSIPGSSPRPDREHGKPQPTTCYTVICVKTAVEISEESREKGLTSRQEARERRIVGNLKPFRWNPAGNQSRPVEPDQQPEASLAWWVGDHPCEA